MRTPLTIVVLLLLPVSALLAQSQQARAQYDEGRRLYSESKYQEALTPVERAVALHADYPEALALLGELLARLDRPADAVRTFERISASSSPGSGYYFYWWGLAHLVREEWDLAAARYRTFLERYDSVSSRTQLRHRVQHRLRYVLESPGLRAAPPTMPAPVNLGPTVNSAQDESAPTLDPTGRTLYFTSQRRSRLSRENGSDSAGWGENVWRTNRTSAGWSAPEMLPEPINTRQNTAAASFSGDGQTMIYAICGQTGGVGSCDLYEATLSGDSWSVPRNLGNVVNSSAWDANPRITADGNAIYFASERTGGYGGSDIYVTRRNRFGEWGIPVNLGASINTPESEARPFLAQDGKTLYFSSSGHPGFGGRDIFVSVWDNDRWGEPRNLGAPLNSPGDDQAFTIAGSGEVGFYTSNRAGPNTDTDVFQVTIPDDMRPAPTVIVAGTVTNAATRAPLTAWVLVEDIQSGELIASFRSNEATGRYLVVLPTGRDYSVAATSSGFFFRSERFTVPDSARFTEIARDIQLSPLVRGTRVVLNNVFFETGSATLSAESRTELRKVLELMTSNPTIVIEVGGHTDNVGAEAANMRLSHNRAMAVREYLVQAGVPGSRVQAKGYGQTSPVAPNDTPEGRQANRRTELIIVDG